MIKMKSPIKKRPVAAEVKTLNSLFEESVASESSDEEYNPATGSCHEGSDDDDDDEKDNGDDDDSDESDDEDDDEDDDESVVSGNEEEEDVEDIGSDIDDEDGEKEGIYDGDDVIGEEEEEEEMDYYLEDKDERSTENNKAAAEIEEAHDDRGVEFVDPVIAEKPEGSVGSSLSVSHAENVQCMSPKTASVDNSDVPPNSLALAQPDSCASVVSISNNNRSVSSISSASKPGISSSATTVSDT